MTATERHRKWLAKTLKAASAPAPAAAGPAASPSALSITVEHLRRYPDRLAPWLRERLGDVATIALRDALDRALAAASPDAAQPADDE